MNHLKEFLNSTKSVDEVAVLATWWGWINSHRLYLLTCPKIREPFVDRASLRPINLTSITDQLPTQVLHPSVLLVPLSILSIMASRLRVHR